MVMSCANRALSGESPAACRVAFTTSGCNIKTCCTFRTSDVLAGFGDAAAVVLLVLAALKITHTAVNNYLFGNSRRSCCGLFDALDSRLDLLDNSRIDLCGCRYLPSEPMTPAS